MTLFQFVVDHPVWTLVILGVVALVGGVLFVDRRHRRFLLGRASMLKSLLCKGDIVRVEWTCKLYDDGPLLQAVFDGPGWRCVFRSPQFQDVMGPVLNELYEVFDNLNMDECRRVGDLTADLLRNDMSFQISNPIVRSPEIEFTGLLIEESKVVPFRRGAAA